MKISELSKITNTPASTLRYYEKIGLLPKVKRDNGIRSYDQNIIQKIFFINSAKETGFPLEEISNFLNIPNFEKNWRSVVKDKIEIIDAEIKKQENIKKALSHILEFGCLDEGIEIFNNPKKQFKN